MVNRNNRARICKLFCITDRDPTTTTRTDKITLIDAMQDMQILYNNH